MSHSPSPSPAPADQSASALTVFRAAAVCTVLTVAMGAIVCATASGASCPTWPGCRAGNIAPAWQLSPLIEFTHRVVAIVTGATVLAAALLAHRIPGRDRWLRVLPWVALVAAIGSGFFGRLVVVGHLPTWLGGVDLTCALIAMALTGIAAVRAGRACHPLQVVPAPPADPADGETPSDVVPGYRLGRRLAAASALTVVAMHVSGIFTAGPNSYTRCMGWPLWEIVDGDLHPWLQAIRLGVATAAALLVVATAVVVGRHRRLHGWGVTLGSLFAIEMVLGLALLNGTRSLDVATAYSVTAVALLSCLGLLTAVAGPTPVAAGADPNDTREPSLL